MPKPLNILSLGAGVQSTTVLLMSIKGELPPLDCAIFADTGWEPKAVYRHLKRLESLASKAGVPVYRVSCGRNIREASAVQAVGGKAKGRGERWATMPLFVKNQDGSEGKTKRQCTTEYKIEPIEKFIKRELLGLKPRQRFPKELAVVQWFGISSDEFSRIRLPVRRKKVKRNNLFGQHAESITVPLLWKDHYYPLMGKYLDGVPGSPKIEYGPQVWMTRQDCIDWLEDNGFGEAPRSACVGCPFHSDDEWLRLWQESPDEFEDACEVDDMIRHSGGMRGEMFLHRSCQPLRDIDFAARVADKTIAKDGGLLNECLGMCGN